MNPHPPRPPPDASGDAPSSDPATAAHVALGMKFLRMAALLDLTSLGIAVDAWRQAVRQNTTAWFAAEGAIAQAVTDTARYHEHRALIRQMEDVFRRATWFRAEAPGARIHAAEPAGQYVAGVAVLALLVRDRLAAPIFELVYRPFAKVIPLESLVSAAPGAK